MRWLHCSYGNMVAADKNNSNISLSLSLVAQETEPSMLPSEHDLMKSVNEGISWLVELWWDMKDNYVAMSLSVASSPSKNMWAWWGWKMRAGRKRILVSPQPPVWKPKERLATIISFTLVSKVTGQGCKCTRLGKQWSSCKHNLRAHWSISKSLLCNNRKYNKSKTQSAFSWTTTACIYSLTRLQSFWEPRPPCCLPHITLASFQHTLLCGQGESPVSLTSVPEVGDQLISDLGAVAAYGREGA